MIAEQALSRHLKHALGLQIKATNREGAHHVDGGDLALDDRVAGSGGLISLVLRHVEAAVRAHDAFKFRVVEGHQVEFVEDGAAGLGSASSQWQQRRVILRTQRPLKAPVALHH